MKRALKAFLVQIYQVRLNVGLSGAHKVFMLDPSMGYIIVK